MRALWQEEVNSFLMTFFVKKKVFHPSVGNKIRRFSHLKLFSDSLFHGDI
ncbi:hypothetical protein FTV88_2172 [Heliorestis convoluta]|uniref:Uncharacterized protein n=1 Tax=Heliorestis convoluta TaxID=356322 RepID=A0A5Q2N7M7_9FIRM|nr:hypothetical protein FTV88_2172 [Heliorestis convoluta]